MYTLYTDKTEDFKCNIGVEGAKISDTKARLVLKNNTVDLLFEGKVHSDGTCVVPIKKLKNILEEGTEGNIRLEVIAEDTFFSPWEDEFTVKTNKKVTVEVANKTTENVIRENKISIDVDINSQQETNHGKVIADLLLENNITLLNLKDNIKTVQKVVEIYTKKHQIKAESNIIIDQIIENLTKTLK